MSWLYFSERVKQNIIKHGLPLVPWKQKQKPSRLYITCKNRRAWHQDSDASKKNIYTLLLQTTNKTGPGEAHEGMEAELQGHLTPAQHWTRSPTIIHSCCPCLPADISPSLLRDLTWWWWKLKQSVQESLRILPWGLLHWVPLLDWSPGAIWGANETKV